MRHIGQMGPLRGWRTIRWTHPALRLQVRRHQRSTCSDELRGRRTPARPERICCRQIGRSQFVRRRNDRRGIGWRQRDCRTTGVRPATTFAGKPGLERTLWVTGVGTSRRPRRCRREYGWTFAERRICRPAPGDVRRDLRPRAQQRQLICRRPRTHLRTPVSLNDCTATASEGVSHSEGTRHTEPAIGTAGTER